MRKIVTVCVVLLAIVPLSLVWGEAEFPKGLEGIVSPYAGSTITYSLDTGNAAQIHFTTGDEPKKVLDFYKQALVKKGWNVEKEVGLAQGGMLLLTKKGSSLNVVAMVPEGENTARVVIGLTTD